nr:MAG TPA: hypothetical protein [Bacteriophage sp.]
MAENIENAGNDQSLNNASHDGQNPSSEMLKPWMKTLGKAFYQNEVLGKYDSLSDAVNALLERPEKKSVPESYSIREGADEVFRKAGLTKAEAEAIDKYYSKYIPAKKPDLKEVLGDKYDEVEKLYRDGVKGISEDLENDIVKAGLDKDPTFVKIMARVGKETGGRPFYPPKHTEEKKMSAAERAVRAAYGIK